MLLACTRTRTRTRALTVPRVDGANAVEELSRLGMPRAVSEVACRLVCVVLAAVRCAVSQQPLDNLVVPGPSCNHERVPTPLLGVGARAGLVQAGHGLGVSASRRPHDCRPLRLCVCARARVCACMRACVPATEGPRQNETPVTRQANRQVHVRARMPQT